MKGKKFTEEHKRKIGLSNLGKKRSIEQSKKLSELRKGRKHSLKTREKMSLSKRGKNHWNWKGGITVSISEWDRLHPENRLVRKQRRRARETNAGGFFTAKQWFELKSKYNFMCLCCKKQEPFIKLTADHIVPIFFGGSSNIENIQPLCDPCNTRKFTKTVDYREDFTVLIQR